VNEQPEHREPWDEPPPAPLFADASIAPSQASAANTLAFSVPGQPMAKGRPRFRHIKTRDGREFNQTYTDKDTEKFENLVRMAARQAMLEADARIFQCPLELHVDLAFAIPASWSGKRKRLAATGFIAHTNRPDWDNAAKIFCDACNGVVWSDDSQIIMAVVSKYYAETPGTRITVVPRRDKEAA